ncbi:hypothetical protein GS432_12150 [Rhodococcus hoagii]|nr:hypothetical protein [Prescottella equi]
MGDRTLLVTALSNLVENAIAYSPKGTPVSVSRTVRGDDVAIAVTDRGIGIQGGPGTRLRAVLPRRQGPLPRHRRHRLGLAIVKHVAANHNGSIDLWSRPGTGSTFTLRIPAHFETVPPEPAAAGENRDSSMIDKKAAARGAAATSLEANR